MKRSLMSIFALAILAVVGCGTDSSETTSQSASLSESSEVSMKEKQSFETKMEKQIDGLQTQVDQMFDQLKESSGDAADKFRTEMDSLKEQLTGLQSEYEKMKDSSGEMWTEAKAKTETLWNHVSTSANEKAAELKANFESWSEQASDKLDELREKAADAIAPEKSGG